MNQIELNLTYMTYHPGFWQPMMLQGFQRDAWKFINAAT